MEGLGLILTIILAGLQSIPTSYYEAADIDGAPYIDKLRYTTLPLLMQSITVTKVMQLTHLINTQIGLALLYAAIEIPISVFLLYGFMSSIPVELNEAGILDGCNPFELFFLIVLPLLKPVLVTVAILCFLNAWNQFIFPLYYLNNSTKWPMTLAVYNFFGQFYKKWSLVSADIILTSLPGKNTSYLE